MDKDQKYGCRTCKATGSFEMLNRVPERHQEFPLLEGADSEEDDSDDETR